MVKVNGINTTGIAKCIGIGISDISKMNDVIISSNTNNPIQSGLLIYYNIDDSMSYDFISANQIVTNIASGGGYNGSIGVAVEDFTVFPNSAATYGTDSNGNFLSFRGSRSSNHCIKVNQTVSLANWSTQHRLKYRSSSSGQYNRILGTRNYRLELTENNNQMWYYQSGWVNTGVSIPNDGEYHDYIWTYQNSPKQFKLYMDGVLVYSTTSRGTTLSSSSYWWVQGSQDGRRSYDFFNKFLLYNKVLNQTEIDNNINI